MPETLSGVSLQDSSFAEKGMLSSEAQSECGSGNGLHGENKITEAEQEFARAARHPEEHLGAAGAGLSAIQPGIPVVGRGH